MKILCASDIHACKEHEREVMTSLREIRQAQQMHQADIVAFAGDWWDATLQNTAQGGLDRFLGELQAIANECPVVMVEGTPSHDVDGSLDVIKRLDTEYGITILEPGKPYFLNDLGLVNPGDEYIGTGDKLLILGLPEPRKKYLLVNGTAGKDATEEAVRKAMHMLCFQLAAIRKQYSDLPCLVVYHGDIAGTTLQNDQTVERGTGIAITIDELASMGADYYHLGHIHKPQQVGNLPAYYAGSAYAKNFGEAHKPGCNLVELIDKRHSPTTPNDLFNYATGWKAEVTRLDFSHPQNLKVSTGFPLKIPTSELQGRRVWVEVTCKKEDQVFFETDAVLTDIMKGGAVPGSKVTVCLEAVETVRAAEITGTSITPEQKLEIWAEQSNVEATDSLKAKAKELVSESILSGVTITGEWALVSVRVRGAIGIWKGIHKDELFVNFDDFDPGLIALSGMNGRGKTTFIENSHAYPQLLTRDKGTLKDHFRLKESFREVIYRDVSTGAEKRFLIQIDGFNRSGGSKYFIFDRASAGEEWKAMPGVDGNLDPYKEAVEAVFGPLELYLRTAFITQKPAKDAPDLTASTKTEKKMLFANLAGIDYLQHFSDSAKERADRTAAESHDAEIKIGILESQVAGKSALQEDITGSSERVGNILIDLETTKTSGTAAKNRVEKLQVAANAEYTREQRAVEAEIALGKLRQELADLNGSIVSLEALSLRRPEIEAGITAYETLKAIIETEEGKLRDVEKRNQLKMDVFRADLDVYNAKKREIEQKITEAKDALREREKAIEKENQTALTAYQESLDSFNDSKRTRETAITKERIEVQKAISTAESLQKEIRFAESALIQFTDMCPTCNQKLPSEKIVELTRKREEGLQRVESMKNEYADQIKANASKEASLNSLMADLAQFETSKPTPPEMKTLSPDDPVHSVLKTLNMDLASLRFDEPQSPPIETFDETVLQEARTQAESMNIEELRNNLSQASEATIRINGLKSQIQDKNRLIIDKQAILDELVRNANPDVIGELEIAKAELAELTEKYRTLTADLSSAQATLDAQKKRLIEIESMEDGLKALRESIRIAKTEAAEWDLLRRAFGPDGIQALELDALAPGIAEVANDILMKSFGDRFRVEFQTTRIAGAGKKTKQVEDFLIYVLDTQDGESTLLDNKSGGEAVWIKRAIYSAFSIIRSRNTGFRFLTSFQDEADGALDGPSRVAYAAMLAAEHDTAKLKHTIIITHSEEVKAMIDQKIDMEVLAEEKAEAREDVA